MSMHPTSLGILETSLKLQTRLSHGRFWLQMMPILCLFHVFVLNFEKGCKNPKKLLAILEPDLVPTNYMIIQGI